MAEKCDDFHATTGKPQRWYPLGFSCSLGELLRLGCCCLLIPVQPFAYVGTNYSGDNRDKKRDDIVSHATGPPSCWRSGMLYIMIHSLAIFYKALCFPAHFNEKSSKIPNNKKTEKPLFCLTFLKISIIIIYVNRYIFAINQKRSLP